MLVLIHPHLNVVGGSERLTQILLYELDRRGFKVLVITGARDPKSFPETRNIKFKLFKHADVGLKNERLSRILDIYVTLEEVLTEDNIKTVFTMIQEPIYLLLAKIINPKVLTAIYIHFPFEEELTRENVEQFIRMYRFPGFYEFMYRFVDLKITNSNYTARVLREKFGLESNVIYPAIPWEFFSEELDINYCPGPTIISVGRFVPHKRLDRLIEIFNNVVRKSVPDSRLIIIGTVDIRYKDYYEKLKELSEHTKGVTLIDRPLTIKELITYYREARVYVHLRIGEHFGMAPVEAMSQGVIPIIPLKSGLAELLTHGFNGFTYKTDDELIKYLIEVLRMSRDEYIKYRRRVYMKASYFNPDRFASDIVSYLGLTT